MERKSFSGTVAAAKVGKRGATWLSLESCQLTSSTRLTLPEQQAMVVLQWCKLHFSCFVVLRVNEVTRIHLYLTIYFCDST